MNVVGVQCTTSWPSILVKLPFDIPKFDGKQGDDPKNHVMTFHLWCSSNSLMDDSVQLQLFQWTLTGTAAKWYIELPQHSFVDFGSLVAMFLTHFHLPIHYEMGTDLLTFLWQNTSTHISNHIHEWRRWRILIKSPILDQLLADWFTKSLFPPIARDVAMGGVVLEIKRLVEPNIWSWSIPSLELCMTWFLKLLTQASILQSHP